MKRTTIAAVLAGTVLGVSGVTAASAHTAPRAGGGTAAAVAPAAAPAKPVMPMTVYTGFTGKRIENLLSSKCLTVVGSGNGLAVTQQLCGASGTQQHWTLSGGVLRNDETGNVLDVFAGNTADGQLVAAWSFWGGSMQYWYTVDKGGANFEIHNSATNKCLDLSGNNTADGATIQQWGCNWGANNNQQWYIVG
jgi:hypothetical protein